MSEQFEQFQRKLVSGGYGSLTGARRGIGKFREMPEDEKEQARAMAEKHFGVEGAPAPKKAATKVKAAEEAPVKERIPKPGKLQRRPKTAASPVVSPEVETRPFSAAEEPMNIVKTALDNLAQVQTLNKNTDISGTLQIAVQVTEALLRKKMEAVGITLDEPTKVADLEEDDSEDDSEEEASAANGTSPGRFTMTGISAGSSV